MDERRISILHYTIVLNSNMKCIARKVFIVIIITMVGQVCSAMVFNAKDYGLVLGDSVTTQTKSIQAAIDACAEKGGGQVIIPSGTYTSGTLFLKSHVELHLSSGCRLLTSKNYDNLPIQPHTHYRSLKDQGGWSALIMAIEQEDIAITGSGIIDGQGKGRKGRVKNVAGDANGRPRNILFISCKHIRVKDITILNAAIWSQHYLDCEDVVVDGITSINHCNGNNDGIDIDGCRDVLLTNSRIDSDDDAIVLKSTGMAPCENVIVKGCIVSSWANGLKLGTESTGGFRNILFSDCIVKPSQYLKDRVIKSTKSGITAISIENVDGGICENVVCDNILIEGTECPIFVRLGNRARKHIPEAPDPRMGTMRGIRLSNITAYNAGTWGCSVTGVPSGSIEDIVLENITIHMRGGLTPGAYRQKGDLGGKRHDMAGNIFSDRYWKDANDLDEDEKGYPQPTLWGNLPCYGMFFRHVNVVTMHNCHFIPDASDPRKKDVIMVDVRKVEK